MQGDCEKEPFLQAEWKDVHTPFCSPPYYNYELASLFLRLFSPSLFSSPNRALSSSPSKSLQESKHLLVMERNLALLGAVLGASAYAVAVLSRRRDILDGCFKLTENVKDKIILRELNRVEEARGYKLIPKGFLSRKSVTTIHVLLY